MDLTWVGYQYAESDGYGKYSNRMIQALQRAGVNVTPCLPEHASMPAWMKRQVGIVPGALTISCLPPYFLQPPPSEGRHWLLSMTEGSELPLGWAETINVVGIERVIVPCEHNAIAFSQGVHAEVSVIPGGTDPQEFPVIERDWRHAPYTFLALADRGARKGWNDVYSAFFKAFGADTPDVRLIIKALPGYNKLLEVMARASTLDPRIEIVTDAVASMRDLYAQADCFAIPSRCEGWGMPMREAAMCGLPAITQRYSGMDDGHTDEWAITLADGKLEKILPAGHIKGEWMAPNVDALAKAMYWCYMNPDTAWQKGQQAATWLRQNQTWDHAIAKLLKLIAEHGA